MRKQLVCLALAAVSTVSMAQKYPATLAVAQPAKTATSGGMQLSSPDIRPFARLKDDQISNGFGCQGKNLSPALTWKNVPASAKALVLTAYDPDAPTGSGFWHWNVVNIPVEVSGLAAGAGSDGGQLPEGAIQLNHDGGQPGFTGACPPPGDKPHRYIFTLYAVSEKLDIPASASPAFLGFSLNGKVLAKAQLTGMYGR